MNMTRLFNLSAVGFLAFVAGAPAIAQDDVDHAPFASKRIVTELDQEGRALEGLINMFMAEDQTILVDSLISLEAALGEARETLELADSDLYEAKIEAAGALLGAIDAEAALDEALIVHGNAVAALARARDELKALNALPAGQENNSEIAFLEAELRGLRRKT